MSSEPGDRKVMYRGGELVSASGGPVRADVLVVEGVVAQVGAGLAVPEEAEVVDCSGSLLIPGMFDLHVHACEPGREDREDIGSASAAALAGGVTGIQIMPDTSPVIDGGGLVQGILDIAAHKAGIDVIPAGAITRGRGGEELSGIAGMKERGVRMLTDADLPVANPLVLRRAMEYARDIGLTIASHCETPELSGDGCVHEGARSYQLGLPGLPAISEEICLYRDVRLAQFTNCRIHIQQISTAESMKAVRYFKEQGVKVTCEVSPHHLIFCQDDLTDYNTLLKVNPPLRPAVDREALVEGLISGAIDCIATDHSPHTEFEKNLSFGEAPFGITGLETAVVSLFHHLVKPGRIGWDVLVRAFSNRPREILGLDPVEIVKGQSANFFIFDPSGTTSLRPGRLSSRSQNTPFLGKDLDGAIVDTVCR